MKITSVEPQKKNLPAGRQGPRRFNIFLDGQFAFGTDEDLVVEWRLVSGKTLTATDLKKILFESEVGRLMERMYRLFNIRQRSEKEVRDYLKNLSFKRKAENEEGISEIAVNLLIEKLKQKRLLNDEEFAKTWVESRSKKKGIQSIKSELYKKGIDKQIIDEVMGQQSSNTSQEPTATRLLQKRLPRLLNLPYSERKNKAYQFLMRRGFEYDLVKSVVENVLKKG